MYKNDERSGRWLRYFFLFALTQSCNRTPAEPTSAEPTPAKHTVGYAKPSVTATSAVAGTTKVTAANEPAPGTAEGIASDARFLRPAAARLVAIGDLHGDFEATKAAFLLAGAIDQNAKWIGGALVIVQTGDQFDRGDDEAQILAFLDRLERESQAVGGAVYVLNGNHETMNVLGDFRYVTPASLSAFDQVQPSSPQAVNVPSPYLGRARAFYPGGGIALKLAKRPLILMVGDTIFAHGGVLPAHVKYGIDRINDETTDWMSGARATPPPLIVDPDGPLWTRLYGDANLSQNACSTLKQVLDSVGARRLVVGHTVQASGMSSACQDQVFRIDVGLSHYYGDRPVQVLEITAQGPKILSAKPE